MKLELYTPRWFTCPQTVTHPNRESNPQPWDRKSITIPCHQHNKRVRPLRGRQLWGRPCSWVRVCCFGAF